MDHVKFSRSFASLKEAITYKPSLEKKFGIVCGTNRLNNVNAIEDLGNKGAMTNAKLSTANVLYIRRSTESGEVLANRFGCHKSLISLIRSGKRYGWVKREEDMTAVERAAYLGESNGTPISEILSLLRETA